LSVLPLLPPLEEDDEQAVRASAAAPPAHAIRIPVDNILTPSGQSVRRAAAVEGGDEEAQCFEKTLFSR
jgi:hypothetical protein